jgi:hypothetical protein
MSEDMSSPDPEYLKAYRKWIEDDEPWPGPEDGEVPFAHIQIVASGRMLGKALGQIGTALHRLAEEVTPRLSKTQRDFILHTGITEAELEKITREIGKSFTKSIKPVEPIKFDRHVPTKPPHSMTGDGKIFDRRGRRRR